MSRSRSRNAPASSPAEGEGAADRTHVDLGIPCWTVASDGRRELVLEGVGAGVVTIVAPRGLFRPGQHYRIECRVARPGGSVRVRLLTEAARREGGRGGGERWLLAVQAATPEDALEVLTDTGLELVEPEPELPVREPQQPPEPRGSAEPRRLTADEIRRRRAAPAGQTPGQGSPRTRDLDRARALFLDTLRRGQFKLPLMPGTAREAIELTRDPNSSFIGLSRVVEKDPPLTAQLLRLANSPLFGGRGATGGLRMALTRIGLRGIRGVLMLASVADVLVVKGHPELTRRLQERAVGTALACSGIAGRAGLDDDEAFTAGVLHDVGWALAFGLMSRLKARLPDGLRAPEAQIELAEALHCELGMELAGHWGLPEVTAEAIGFHHEPARAPTEPQLAYCVQAARTILDRIGLHPEDREASKLGCEAFGALRLIDPDVNAVQEDVRHRLGLPQQ